MRSFWIETGLSLALSGALAAVEVAEQSIPNEKINYRAFLQAAVELADERQERRVTEEEFLRLSRQEGVVVLDTRSAAKYKQLHVAGAKHVNFSDITEGSLAEAIPSKETPVLIYCNNNFRNQPVAFAEKRAPTALNIPTFITLRQYGYQNVYELGPVIDPADSKLSFEGTLALKKKN